MPSVVSSCAQCGTQFHWNSDHREVPDCPKCGHNPHDKYRQSFTSGLMKKLKSRNRAVSSNAAVELGARGDSKAVEALIRALNGPNKWAEVIALGRLGDARAVEPLIRIMEEEQAPEAAATAAKALVGIGTPRAIGAVFANMKRLGAYHENQVATEVIERGGGLRFVLMALEDASPAARKEAALILGELAGEPEVRSAAGLLAELLKDPDGEVIQAATEALNRMGWKPNAAQESNEDPNSARSRFLHFMANRLHLGPGLLTDDARFVDDLGFDSFDSMDYIEFLVDAQEELGLELPEEIDQIGAEIETVGDAIRYIEKSMGEHPPKARSAPGTLAERVKDPDGEVIQAAAETPKRMGWKPNALEGSNEDSNSVRSRVLHIMTDSYRLAPGLLTDNTCFVGDLGFDSLDYKSFLMEVEEEFDVELDEQVSQFETVGDAIRYIEKLTG